MMEPKAYWKLIHEMRSLTKRIKGDVCKDMREKLRPLFVRLEGLQEELVDDFKDKEDY